MLELIGEFGAQAVVNDSRLDTMSAWIKASVETERWRETGDVF